MPLPRKFKRHTFAICFGISLFPFVAFNLLVYMFVHCGESCSIIEIGFPFRWYVACAWTGENMNWEAFVLNIKLALTASLISAKILKPTLEPID